MSLARKVLVVGGAGVFGVTGCSSSTTKDISSAVARNTVAVGATKEFRDHHHSLDGLPTCKTTPVPESNTQLNIACRGKTEKGEPAVLIGRTNGANEVRGTFSGLVAGKTIFSTTCIGC